MEKLSKFKIFIFAFFQILFIKGLIQDIITNGSIVTVQKSIYFIIGVGVSVIILIYIYWNIAKKFWDIRKNIIYRIFAILNIIYIANMLINILISFTNINIKFMRGPNFIVLAFLIINLVLIITYNRNLRAIKKKEKPV